MNLKPAPATEFNYSLNNEKRLNKANRSGSFSSLKTKTSTAATGSTSGLPLSPSEGANNNTVETCFTLRNLRRRLQVAHAPAWSTPTGSLQSARFMADSRVMTSEGVRDKVSMNRGSGSTTVWPQMPEVPDAAIERILKTVSLGVAARTSPIVTLIKEGSQWRVHSNGWAIQVLKWFPRNAVRTEGSHRPWFNVFFSGTTRIYCADADRLIISLSRGETKDGEIRVRGFNRSLIGLDTPSGMLSDEVTRSAARLTAASNVLLFCDRYAEDRIAEAKEAAMQASDTSGEIMKSSVEGRKARTLGSPYEYATGASSKEQAMEDMEAIDATRIPAPDTSLSMEQEVNLSLETLSKEPLLHRVDTSDVTEFLKRRVRTARRSTWRKIGNVPMRARSGLEMGQSSGGFAQGVRLMAASELKAGDEFRHRLAMGESASPTAHSVSYEKTKYETGRMLSLAFSYSAKWMKRIREKGWLPSVLVGIRPPREGAKKRVFDLLPIPLAFAQRFTRPVLAAYNDVDPCVCMTRDTVSCNSLRFMATQTKSAEFVISPDASAATDAMEHEKMRAVYLEAIERVKNGDFSWWVSDPRFSEHVSIEKAIDFMKDAVFLYTMETKMINQSVFKRVKALDVFETEKPIGYEVIKSDAFPAPPRVLHFPHFEGRVLGGVKHNIVIKGAVSSGKSIGVVLDLLRNDNGLKCIVIAPRRVAVSNMYSQAKKILGDDPLISDLGMCMQDEKDTSNARVIIGTAGSCLGRIKRGIFLVIDEAHEATDPLDTLRAKAIAVGCRRVEMSATPPDFLSDWPSKYVERFDGRTREVITKRVDSFKKAIRLAVKDAELRGARALMWPRRSPKL